MRNLGYNGRRNICGERVRMARLAKRMSQEALAGKMQMKGVNITHRTRSAISNQAAAWSRTTNFAPLLPSFERPSKTFWTRKNKDPQTWRPVGLFPLDITPQKA